MDADRVLPDHVLITPQARRPLQGHLPLLPPPPHRSLTDEYLSDEVWPGARTNVPARFLWEVLSLVCTGHMNDSIVVTACIGNPDTTLRTLGHVDARLISLSLGSSYAPVTSATRGQGCPRAKSPYFGPSQKLDFELEMAAIVGPRNELGKPVDVNKAADHIFGLVLLNDWSGS